jgi:dienelactone hydrolase
MTHRSLVIALVVLLLETAFAPCRAAAPRESAQSRKIRAAFMKRFERPRVASEPIVVSSETRDGLLREKITVASEAGVRVPVLLIRKASGEGRLPAVVCLHGLGGNKEGLAGYLEEFARRGFVGVALDARYHGDRAGNLTQAMAESFRTGKEHPYLWDTVWDTWRVLDYLQTRSDVDKDRLGVMGISLGGHTTWMVSADSRVKAAVPCISVCSWRWQLEHQGYKQRVSNLQGAFDAVRDALGEKEVNPKVVAAAWDRWMPGIPKEFDCQDLLAAMAPRPLLILGGDSDPVAPLEGAKVAFDAIEKAYKKAGATDRLQIIIAEKSGHTVTGPQQQALYAWFDRWLKPPIR